jgi:hypothetical protein
MLLRVCEVGWPTERSCRELRLKVATIPVLAARTPFHPPSAVGGCSSGSWGRPGRCRTRSKGVGVKAQRRRTRSAGENGDENDRLVGCGLSVGVGVGTSIRWLLAAPSDDKGRFVRPDLSLGAER